MLSLSLVKRPQRVQSLILLAYKRHPHLSSTVNVTFAFHQFSIVFNGRVIQITLVRSRRLSSLMEVITDTVRFQIAL